MEDCVTKLKGYFSCCFFCINKNWFKYYTIISSFILDNFKYRSFIQISSLSFLGFISILFLNNKNKNKNLLLFDN